MLHGPVQLVADDRNRWVMNREQSCTVHGCWCRSMFWPCSAYIWSHMPHIKQNVDDNIKFSDTAADTSSSLVWFCCCRSNAASLPLLLLLPPFSRNGLRGGAAMGWTGYKPSIPTRSCAPTPAGLCNANSTGVRLGLLDAPAAPLPHD